MAENESQNNISKGSQDGNTQENPMKAVKTTSLPVKHGFSSDQGAKMKIQQWARAEKESAMGGKYDLLW